MSSERKHQLQAGYRASFVTIDEELGKPGEQAEVWRASAAGSESLLFAVKVAHKPPDPGTFDNFREEFKILAELNSHPNIVSVFDTGTTLEAEDGTKVPGKPFYIMEYLGEGVQTLAHVLRNSDTTDEHRGLRLVTATRALFDIAEALRFAHSRERPCYHQDVKSPNVLVIPDKSPWTPRVTLIDFGFGKMLDPDGPPSPQVPSGPAAVSTHRPQWKPESSAHLDVWQLARTFSLALDYPTTEDNDLLALPQVRRHLPIDYAEFPRLLHLLTEWSVDPGAQKGPTADPAEFFVSLFGLRRDPMLHPDVGASLRFLAIEEISTHLHLQPCFQAMRIPARQLVVYTKRIAAAIGNHEFGRLRNTRQLGFTHLVYPGAQGTRFEHAMGVFSLACRFVAQMSGSPPFRALIRDARDVEKFLVAALLHDVGHFPYSHQLEEFSSADFGDRPELKALTEHHEIRSVKAMSGLEPDQIGAMDAVSNSILDVLGMGNAQEVAEIAHLVAGKRFGVPAESNLDALTFLRSVIDGDVDLDKLDYIERDANHCGVPYGDYLDVDRIFETMRILDDGNRGLALGFDIRGLGPLEQMVFARHQLYAHVYWHRAVRTVVSMFRHAVYLLGAATQRPSDLIRCFQRGSSDDTCLHLLIKECRRVRKRTEEEGDVRRTATAERLLKTTSGADRMLYKTAYEQRDSDEPIELFYGSDYARQRSLASGIYEGLGDEGVLTEEGQRMGPDAVLVDCRPRKFPRFNVLVQDGTSVTPKRLADVSPAVGALKETFVRQACRTRIFVAPEAIRPRLLDKSAEGRGHLEELTGRAIAKFLDV